MSISLSYGPARSPSTKSVALITAGIMIVTLLAQLYGFDDFASTLAIVLPINDQQLIKITAALIVIVELLSLPYLLGMYMSSLMRIISASCGLGVCGFWLITALTNAHASNSALLSATVAIPGGILAVVWAGILMTLFLKVVLTDTRFRHDTSSAKNQ